MASLSAPRWHRKTRHRAWRANGGKQNSLCGANRCARTRPNRTTSRMVTTENLRVMCCPMLVQLLHYPDHLSASTTIYLVVFGMSAPRLRPFTATKVLIIIDSYSSAVDRIQAGEMDHEIPVLTISNRQICKSGRRLD